MPSLYGRVKRLWLGLVSKLDGYLISSVNCRPASSQKLDFRLDDGQLTVGARVFDAADGSIISRHNWIFARKQLWIVCRGVKVELIQYRCHLDVRVLC